MTTEHSGGGDINRSLALMWEMDEKATRGPKPALTLDRLVAAAIDIADAEGLESVSMRRIAEALGVGTMSLYRYVPGKAELLDLMLDRVIGPPDVDELGPGWRNALEAMGRDMWKLYTDHPWLPFVDQSRPLLGPNSFAGLELILRSLTDCDLSDKEKINAISMIEAYAASMARTHNSAEMAEKRTGVSSDEFWETQAPVLDKALSTGQFPTLAALSDDAFTAYGEELFEFGLRCMLDGVEVMLRQRSAPRAG